MISIVYHCYLVGNWKEIVNEFEIPLCTDVGNKLIVDLNTLRIILPQQKPEELNEL